MQVRIQILRDDGTICHEAVEELPEVPVDEYKAIAAAAISAGLSWILAGQPAEDQSLGQN